MQLCSACPAPAGMQREGSSRYGGAQNADRYRKGTNKFRGHLGCSTGEHHGVRAGLGISTTPIDGLFDEAGPTTATLARKQFVAAPDDHKRRILPCLDARLQPGLHIDCWQQTIGVGRVYGIDLILYMDAGDASPFVSAGEMKGVSNSLSQGISVSDERNLDSRRDSRSLLKLFHLGKNAIVRHRVVEGAASVPAEIGCFEPNAFHYPSSERAVCIGSDEMCATVDQVTQLFCLARHALALSISYPIIAGDR